MYKKLDENDLQKLLEAGIEEFAVNGLDRASINAIAKKAGLSVGVLYKYYRDKDAFFLACVKHSLKLLESTMAEAVRDGAGLWESIGNIVRALIRQAGTHGSYYVMYNEITSGSCRKYAAELAAEIEGGTAGVYRALMEKAQAEGLLDKSADPRMFAFFFDNLLMMLQFSYSCDYYRERMKLFCGEDIDGREAELERNFMLFIGRALGLPQSQ